MASGSGRWERFWDRVRKMNNGVTKGTFAYRRKNKAIATASKVDFSGGFEAPAPGNPW